MKTRASSILLSLGLLLNVPLIALAETSEESEQPAATEEVPATESVPLQEIRAFTEIFARIKNDYVDQVEDKQLLEDAIRGMLAGLDPHSSYLDQEAYQDLQEGTTGEFGGLGIEVGMEDGFLRVIAPIDDTPAAKAGVMAGDTIIRLDDTAIKGMSLSDAVAIMRGKPGSEITLTILRESIDKPVELTITRAIIKVKSVRTRTLEPGFGYVRISNFQSHTGNDLRTAIKSLKEDNPGLKGIILDLRNNPGGVLSAAVAVSDAFLESGLIVYTEGRDDDSQLKFSARGGDLIDGAPIVVLVNGGSASASEIVAGALQDHQRAVIMGEKTFGKGSVQTILPMTDETALKLTTARYFTPNGRSIQAAGIKPDIVIDKVQLAAREEPLGIIKESDLSGHLENNGDDIVPDAADDIDGVPQESLATTDYELYEALNLLKGIVIMSRKN